MDCVKQGIKKRFPFLVPALRFLRALPLRAKSQQAVYEDIYRENSWQDRDSRSGSGSNLDQTKVVRERLPALLEKHAVRSMLDAPCGDFFWLRQLDLPLKLYIGVDIVPELIQVNLRRYGTGSRKFRHLDVTEDDLPQVDLILCRDLLVHMSYKNICRALKKMQASGSTYLLTTTFVRETENKDVLTGQWRRLNLARAPFSFPTPIELIDEQSTEQNEYKSGSAMGKSLGLWRLADLQLPE